MPYEIVYILILISYVLIAAEWALSMFKNDKRYDRRAFSNVLRGIFVELTALRMMPLYILGYLYITQAMPDSKITLLSILFALLIVDLCWYLFHRFHHTYRFAQTLHTVHHSDRTFNLSTAIRISWIEQLYLPIFFFPAMILIDNVYLFLLTYLYLNAHQFLAHSAYIRLPRFFDYVFVTPHNHRIHHDQALVNQNSNFGGIFSIWDRLFGTYVSDIKEFTPGIKGYSQDNFIMMEVDPIVRYIKSVVK